MMVSPDEPPALAPRTDPVLDLSSTPPTEARNAATSGIDLLPTPAILGLLHAEDQSVPDAVRPVLGVLATIVDEAADRVRRGGRVHYFGAGSSGRIAALDAAELVPTFGLTPGIVVAHLAGGERAMFRAVEGAEDDEQAGAADAGGVTAADLVIGLSASGRTPYVAGALAAAASRGAFTAVATCNPDSPLRALAQAALAPDTGPEALTGSTRLKATSALKLILNGFSTALMIRLGKTYSNLMVEVSATNDKLRTRRLRILREATGEPRAMCEAALAAAGGDLRVALVALVGGVSAAEASAALAATGDGVRAALTALGGARLTRLPWVPRAADALGLGGGERPLERVHRARQVALRKRDEQAVHDRELRDPAGRGTGAEHRLARRRQQHVVGHLGDRRPREVRDRDRGGPVRAGLGERVDRVHGGAGVRQADRHVAGAAQRRGRDRHVRVGPGLGGPGDALELHLQVAGHEPAGADAVDVDPAGARERVDDLDERPDVEAARGLGHRGRVGVGDLLGDRHRVVVRVDVA
jgi:N-acetylmuramic acid 6-phosphate etherase